MACADSSYTHPYLESRPFVLKLKYSCDNYVHKLLQITDPQIYFVHNNEQWSSYYHSPHQQNDQINVILSFQNVPHSFKQWKMRIWSNHSHRCLGTVYVLIEIYNKTGVLRS